MTNAYPVNNFPAHYLHFEDYEVGVLHHIPVTYSPTEQEIIEVASKWDPQPFHVDPIAAKDSIFGGLVASSAHAFPNFVFLGQQGGEEYKPAAISALGFDKLRFSSPIRPNDVLRYEWMCIEKRISQSRPFAGIVVIENRMFNQRDELVFSGQVSSLLHLRALRKD